MDEEAKQPGPNGYVLCRAKFHTTTNVISVIATKYTTNLRSGPSAVPIMANYTGNGAKSLHVSVNASLKKLQTDYIDLVRIPTNLALRS